MYINYLKVIFIGVYNYIEKNGWIKDEKKIFYVFLSDFLNYILNCFYY